MILSTFSLMVLFIIAGLGFAQELHEIEPVIVTATRYPVNILDIARTITVIDSSEIVNYSSLSEILAGITGVDMKIRGDGIQADPSIRGSSFQQVLVMIDGVRVNDPQTGHHNLNIPIILNAIERIEILHGTASSLYGSDACGGAINIITKRHTGIGGGIAIGSFGYGQGDASFSTDDVSLNFELKSSDGYEEGYEYALQKINAKVNTNIAKNSNIDFLFSYLNKDFGAKNFYAPYPSWESNQAFVINLSNRWSVLPGIMLNPTLFLRTHVDSFVLDRDDPSFYANRHQSYTYGAQLTGNVDLSGFGYFVAGGEIFRDSLTSARLGERGVQHIAAFIQGEKRFVNNDVILIIGLRYDHYTDLANSFNPHISFVYHMRPHLKLRSCVGSSFRMPSFTELYYHDPANMGDSLLEPERAREYEVGIDYYLKNVTGSVSLFTRETEKNIDWVKRGFDTAWRVENIGSTTFYGGEAKVDLRVKRWLEIGIGFSHVRIDHELPAEYVSKYVLQTPLSTFSCGLAILSMFDIRGRWILDRDAQSSSDRILIDCIIRKEMQLSPGLKLSPS